MEVKLSKKTKILRYLCFAGCIRLEQISLPESIVELEEAVFNGSKSLKRIQFEVKEIQIKTKAFSYCDELEIVAIEAKNASIEDEAFYNCNKISKVLINCNNINNFTGAFSGCLSLTDFNISIDVNFSTYFIKNLINLKNLSIRADNVEANGSHIKNVKYIYINSKKVDFFGSDYSQLVEVILDCDNGRIDDNCFSFCSQLSKIVLPKRLEYLGSDSLRKTSIESIEIPLGITVIPPYLCDQCKYLENVTFRDKVTEIGIRSFSSCLNLKNVGPLNDIEIIQAYSFYYSTSLTKIKLSKIRIIDSNAFCNCINLSAVDFGCSPLRTISNQAFSHTSIGSLELTHTQALVVKTYSFQSCNNLTSVRFSNVQLIENYAFDGCSMLEDLFINSSDLYSINVYSFKNCFSLKAVTLLGNLSEVYSYAFLNCTSLLEFKIGSNAVSSLIHPYILSLCSSLTTVLIEANSIILDVYSFSKLNSLDYFDVRADNINVDNYIIAYSTVKLIEMKGRINFLAERPFDNADFVERINLISSYDDSIKVPMHFHCMALETLFIQAGIINISRAFCGAFSLKNLFLKCNQTNFLDTLISCPIENIIIDGVVRTSNRCFINLGHLKNITVLKNNRYTKENTFLNNELCVNSTTLKYVSIESNAIHIHNSAFQNCIALEVFRTKGMLSTESYSFKNCKSLSHIECTEAKYIHSFISFIYCPSIKYINFQADDDLYLELHFGGVNFLEEIKLSADHILFHNRIENATSLRRVYLNYSFLDFVDSYFYNCSNFSFLQVNGTDYNGTLDYSTLDMFFFDRLKRCGFSEVRNINLSIIGNQLAYYPNLEFVSFTNSNITSMNDCFVGSPKLHTIFFAAFQSNPIVGLLEIPPTVTRAINVVRGSLIRKLIIPSCGNYLQVIYDCITLETLQIKVQKYSLDHLVIGTPNLNLILLQLNISGRISHFTHEISVDAEVYYCGSENYYTQNSGLFLLRPKAVYVTKMYAGERMGGLEVRRISMERCLRMIGEYEGPESNCKIEGKSQMNDLIPVFLFIMISRLF